MVTLTCVVTYILGRKQTKKHEVSFLFITRRTSVRTQPSFSSYNDRVPGENVHYSLYEL